MPLWVLMWTLSTAIDGEGDQLEQGGEQLLVRGAKAQAVARAVTLRLLVGDLAHLVRVRVRVRVRGRVRVRVRARLLTCVRGRVRASMVDRPGS